MTTYQNAYYKAVAPRAGDVFSRAGSATPATYATPRSWRGRFVNFVSLSDNLIVAFGDAGVSVAATKVSVSTGTAPNLELAPHRGTGYPVPAGTPVSFFVEHSMTHFSVVSSGATGYWYAFAEVRKDPLAEFESTLGKPFLDLRAEDYSTLTLASGDVASWKSRDAIGFEFSEASNRPALVNAGSSVTNAPSVGFTAGNSDKLVCSSSTLCAYFAGTSSFTVYIVASRGATGAAHTLFSVGTAATDNGRFDLTLDASDDTSITRVDSGGSSANATVTESVGTGSYIFTLIFNGTTFSTYRNRSALTLSGSVGGDIGTPTKVSIGCRGYNTSTNNQFLTGQVAAVIAYPEAHSGLKLETMHSILQREYGNS